MIAIVLVLFLGCLLFAGCSSESVILRHPQTGATVTCGPYSHYGYFGALHAAVYYRLSTQRLRANNKLGTLIGIKPCLLHLSNYFDEFVFCKPFFGFLYEAETNSVLDDFPG